MLSFSSDCGGLFVGVEAIPLVEEISLVEEILLVEEIDDCDSFLFFCSCFKVLSWCSNPKSKCTLCFASILSSSLLLYLPCLDVCRDLKPHEWDGHRVRRKSR